MATFTKTNARTREVSRYVSAARMPGTSMRLRMVFVLALAAAKTAAAQQTLVVTNAGQTVRQGDTVSINTIPNMPSLALSVDGSTSCDTLSYTIDIGYTDQAGFVTEVQYNATGLEADTPNNVDWLGVLQGGSATITWWFDDVEQTTSFNFSVNGINPSNSTVNAYLASGNAPWFGQNLVAWESGAWSISPTGQYKQFNPNNAVYFVIWGTPDGVGLMQLEQPARASGGQDFWAWPLNVADGLHWLYKLKQGPAYNSWNNELQQMQADMAPGQKYPPDTEYTYCYFSYPQNGNDTYADGDWIHYYNGDYFIFWDHSNLIWNIDTTGYVSNVCNTPPAR